MAGAGGVAKAQKWPEMAEGVLQVIAAPYLWWELVGGQVYAVVSLMIVISDQTPGKKYNSASWELRSCRRS